ncbi:hypothetical protein OLO84_07180 [Campylobacter jejuni]|nr:hypothetical protein [Campylobacter jejuni]MCW1320888.1 hypothetical protein [Campylobacter jejuni]
MKCVFNLPCETLRLGRTNAFFLWGEKSLVNAYFNTAKNLGVEIFYEI